MKFEAPQLIMLALMALGIGIDMERHGKPKAGTHNVGTSFVAAGISITLLWWGGFFG